MEHAKIVSYQFVEFRGRELALVEELVKEGTLKKYIQKKGKL